MSINPLTTDERLSLDKLIKESENYKDTTEHIRKVKHSKKIITCVGIIEQLKIQYADIKRIDPNQFADLCKTKCEFLYNKYTDIFNKLVSDELDLQLLNHFLRVLRAIEEGQIDQNEGSVIVGKLLKEIYVDSALKRGAKLDAQNETQEKEKVTYESRGVSWDEYRATNPRGQK